MTKAKMSIARLSRKVRSKFCLTQEDLAEILEISQATVSRIEAKKLSGRKYQPRLDFLLAKGLEGMEDQC